MNLLKKAGADQKTIETRYQALTKDIPKPVKQIMLPQLETELKGVGGLAYKTRNLMAAIRNAKKRGVKIDPKIEQEMSLKKSKDIDAIIQKRKDLGIISKEEIKIKEHIDETGNLRSEALQAKINLAKVKYDQVFSFLYYCVNVF